MEAIFKIFSKKAATKKNRQDLAKSDLRRLMPYGDQLGDGAMQLSFTLPVSASDQAREAAKKYVEKLGFHDVLVAVMEPMGSGLSYFVVYGRSKQVLDFTKVKVSKADFQKMDFDQVHEFAEQHLKRRLTVVGATTGTDAHTVGLDAIMNMKGYMGDYGLERYACFKAYNLRSQVSHEELIAQAVRLKADVILVSKVVTQRNQHLEELKSLAKAFKAEKRLPSKLIKIVGGPRLTHDQARKLGYNAGFGPGTLPSEVASFIVQAYVGQVK